MTQDFDSQQASTGQAKDAAREQAGAVGQQAKEEAASVSARAQSEAGHVAERARQEGSQVAEQAAAQARTLYDDALGQMQSQAQQQTDRLADGMQDLAGGLQALANGEPQQAGALAGYVGQLGDRLGEVGQRMHDMGYEGVLGEVRRYARRRPGTFLLGAAAAGLVAGRLVRGERDRQQQGPGQQQGFYRAPGESLGAHGEERVVGGRQVEVAVGDQPRPGVPAEGSPAATVEPGTAQPPHVTGEAPPSGRVADVGTAGSRMASGREDLR